jgi:hypothetical protein
MEDSRNSTASPGEFEGVSFRAALRRIVRAGAAMTERDAQAVLMAALAEGRVAARGITYHQERTLDLIDDAALIPPADWDECPLEAVRGVVALLEPGRRLPRWQNIEIDAATLRQAFEPQAKLPPRQTKSKSKKDGTIWLTEELKSAPADETKAYWTKADWQVAIATRFPNIAPTAFREIWKEASEASGNTAASKPGRRLKSGG